jgi:hypothetical protein
MNWEKRSQQATVLQTAVVVISLIIIWYQLRQQVRLTRAANTQAAVAQVMPLNLQLVQNREVNELWLKGNREEQMSDVERDRYLTLMDTFLIFYENLFWQHHNGLLDDNIYNAWDVDFKYFIRQTHLEKEWNRKRDAYHEEFRNHVDDLIKQVQAETKG